MRAKKIIETKQKYVNNVIQFQTKAPQKNIKDEVKSGSMACKRCEQLDWRFNVF